MNGRNVGRIVIVRTRHSPFGVVFLLNPTAAGSCRNLTAKTLEHVGVLMKLVEFGTLRLVVLIIVIGRETIEVLLLNNWDIFNHDEIGLVLHLRIGQSLHGIDGAPRVGGFDRGFGLLLLNSLHLLGDKVGHLLVHIGRGRGHGRFRRCLCFCFCICRFLQ